MKNVHLLSYFLLGRPPWYNLQGQLKEPFVIGKVVVVVNFMLQKFLQPHPHTLVFDKSMRKKLAKFLHQNCGYWGKQMDKVYAFEFQSERKPGLQKCLTF